MTMMKVLLTLAFLAAVACSSISKLKPQAAKLEPHIFNDIGMEEIERNPKNERGPNPGSFVSPTFLDSKDVFVSTVGGTLGLMSTQSGSFRWKKTYQIGVGSRPALKGDT